MIGKNIYACCYDHNEGALLKWIGELATECRGKGGGLIQVLHIAQGVYGYLSLEVQKVITGALSTSLVEVSGVVALYSFFSTQPRGEHTIRVCLETIYYIRGGKEIVERLEELLDAEIGEAMVDRK